MARGNGSMVYPQKVLLDTLAQSILLKKNLAENLGSKAKDLDPCPFTIATSLGGIEHPTEHTKEPFRLQFKVSNDAYTHISIRCVVTSVTTYNMLLGQQTLYFIGFGYNCWIGEA